MVRIDRRIQNCKQAIEEKYPGYFNVKYGYLTPALQDVRSALKDRDQVALEFFWGAEWVYGLGISADTIAFEKIGRPDSIAAEIEKVLNHFDENTSGISADNHRSFVTYSHALYKKMVKPFASLIEGHGRILIIPDGPINQVPFEILLREAKTMNTVDYRSLQYLIK